MKEIFDHDESGVNHAVSLADDYLEKVNMMLQLFFHKIFHSCKQKILKIFFKFQKFPKSVLVVPSRRFDGTNALVRTL